MDSKFFCTFYLLKVWPPVLFDNTTCSSGKTPALLNWSGDAQWFVQLL